MRRSRSFGFNHCELHRCLRLGDPLDLRLPKNQNSGIPISGSSKIVNSHARLLAGERRCLRMPDTTRSANGIIRIPTATTVPASAKLKDQAELNIYAPIS